MRILAVDHNFDDLQKLSEGILSVNRGCELNLYQDPMLAYKFALKAKIDMLYTTIHMRGLNGFLLAKMIHENDSNVKLVFISNDDSNKQEAKENFNHAYYVTKPITREKLLQIESEA